MQRRRTQRLFPLAYFFVEQHRNRSATGIDADIEKSGLHVSRPSGSVRTARRENQRYVLAPSTAIPLMCALHPNPELSDTQIISSPLTINPANTPGLEKS
jgi:hypothetical protein